MFPKDVVAIQLESPMAWRMDESKRREYAAALAESVVEFIVEELLPNDK